MDAGAGADPVCVLDSDCPGPKLCYVNMSWSEEEAFCGCTNWFGKTGDDCLGLGPNAIIMSIVSGTLILIASGITLAALVDGFATVRAFGRDLQASAANSTLLLTTLSLISFVAWMVSYMHELLAPWEGDALEIYADGTKESVYKISTSVAITGVQTFTFLACLNVSVMWIEMSQRARKMTPKMANNVSKYRRACLGVGSLLTVLTIGVMASGKLEFAILVALPFLLGLSVFFIVGRIRMVRLLNEAISRTGESLEATEKYAKTGSGPRPSSAAFRTHRTLVSIKRCSRRVIVGTAFTVLGGMLYLGTATLPERGWRDLSPTGGLCPPALLALTMPISLLYALGSIFVYCHRTTRKLIRRKLGINTNDSSAFSETQPKSFTNSFELSSAPEPRPEANLFSKGPSVVSSPPQGEYPSRSDFYRRDLRTMSADSLDV